MIWSFTLWHHSHKYLQKLHNEFSFKKCILLDSGSWTPLRISWKLPKAACSLSILGCFNNLEAVPSCKRNRCCGPKQHHLSNTIYKAPDQKKLQITEKKRVWKIQYIDPAPIAPKNCKKISAGWVHQVENTRDPLAARAKTLKGFSAVVKKPAVKVHHFWLLWNCFSWGKRFVPLIQCTVGFTYTLED